MEDSGDASAVDASGTDDAGSKDPASVWDGLQGISMTALSSQVYSAGSGSAAVQMAVEDHYVVPSDPVCTDEWIDFGCDEVFPLFPPSSNCEAPQRIDYDPAVSCPVCLDPPETEPSCGEVRKRYLEFLDHNLRETCTNWCETAEECVVHELDACGITIAFALRGLVDEEPISFAESFGLDNCAVCTGEPEPGNLKDHLTTACENNQCVLVATPPE